MTPRRPRLSLCEWLDFLAALHFVHSQRTSHEFEALRLVRFVASAEAASLRGFFHGVQACREPLLEDRIRPGSLAEGTIMIYVRSHPPHDLRELAVTVHHEIDHALGGDETEVRQLAATRIFTHEDVQAHRIRREGLRLIVPEAQPARIAGPPRPTAVFC